MTIMCDVCVYVCVCVCVFGLCVVCQAKVKSCFYCHICHKGSLGKSNTEKARHKRQPKPMSLCACVCQCIYGYVCVCARVGELCVSQTNHNQRQQQRRLQRSQRQQPPWQIHLNNKNMCRGLDGWLGATCHAQLTIVQIRGCQGEWMWRLRAAAGANKKRIFISFYVAYFAAQQSER